MYICMWIGNRRTQVKSSDPEHKSKRASSVPAPRSAAQDKKAAEDASHPRWAAQQSPQKPGAVNIDKGHRNRRLTSGIFRTVMAKITSGYVKLPRTRPMWSSSDIAVHTIKVAWTQQSPDSDSVNGIRKEAWVLAFACRWRNKLEFNEDKALWKAIKKPAKHKPSAKGRLF